MARTVAIQAWGVGVLPRDKGISSDSQENGKMKNQHWLSSEIGGKSSPENSL